MKTLALEEQSLDSIPFNIAETEGKDCTYLSLKWNSISNLTKLDSFPVLETLILDQNSLTGIPSSCPILPTVTTLWVNNNKIKDLLSFVEEVRKSFPNLQYLSMMQNPCCQTTCLTASKLEIENYRKLVAARLPHLKLLDYLPVTATEKGNFVRHSIVVTPSRGSKCSQASIVNTGPENMSPGSSVDSQSTEDLDRKKLSSNEEDPEFSASYSLVWKSRSKLSLRRPRVDIDNSEGNRYITDDCL
mmetsp:Transcript_1671/g.2387  ORF Transcript_1671/g.2387 Transcript_1671/m.2387 type:complete len:245 (-) Transcript_1671:274-1008(-)